MSQGEDAYLVLRGVFHVSPPALGGLSIDGKLTFSNNAYLNLTTEWIMLHGELTNRNLRPRCTYGAASVRVSQGDGVSDIAARLFQMREGHAQCDSYQLQFACAWGQPVFDLPDAGIADARRFAECSKRETSGRTKRADRMDGWRSGRHRAYLTRKRI